MPCDYSLYPPEWRSIRSRILERAGHVCEFCGVANYAPDPVSGRRVVLTIAHLDHDLSRNDDANLRALCQRCHNRYDIEHRQANAAVTRRRKRETTGQLPIEWDGESAA